MKYMTMMLVLSLFVLSGCAGPQLNKECNSVSNRDNEQACKGDEIYSDCDPILNMDRKFVCGPAKWKDCASAPGFDGFQVCRKR